MSSWMASKQRTAQTIKIAWHLHGAQGFVLTAREGVRHVQGSAAKGFREEEISLSVQRTEWETSSLLSNAACAPEGGGQAWPGPEAVPQSLRTSHHSAVSPGHLRGQSKGPSPTCPQKSQEEN